MAFTTSADRYARLVELTCRITGIQSMPEGYDPWKTLIYTWSLFHRSLQCRDLLFATLHFIKWGAYPRSEDQPLMWACNKGTALEEDTTELLTLFRLELLCPGAEGAAELHDWDGFKHTYYHFSHDNGCSEHGLKSRSWEHQCYLEGRLNHLIHTSDPTDERWIGYKYFEEAIHVLLPTSSAWTEENWLDEVFILKALDRAFGTNLEDHPDTLDSLLRIVSTTLRGNTMLEYSLADLPIFPLSLAKVIWPVNTTTQISEAYQAVVRVARENENRAKRRKSKKLASYEFGFADVKATGIHQLTRDLVSLKTIKDQAVKKLVFNVETCH